MKYQPNSIKKQEYLKKLDPDFLFSQENESSLEEIGELLNKLSKNVSKSNQVINEELIWSKRREKFGIEPIRPEYLLNPDMMDGDLIKNKNKVREIVDQVRYEAQNESPQTYKMSKLDKFEVEIYKNLKKDPYFQHHLRHKFRYLSDQMNSYLEPVVSLDEKSVQSPDIIFDTMVPKDKEKEIVKKKIELFRTLRGGKKGWGSGMRKSSRTVASVQEGTGKIIANGKPLTQYMHMASQRWPILKPLIVTQYTCRVDVELFLRGGGITGQTDSAAIAIAKALVKYDPSTYPILKHFRCLITDYRQVERKKPGLTKARKGVSYVRR